MDLTRYDYGYENTQNADAGGDADADDNTDAGR